MRRKINHHRQGCSPTEPLSVVHHQETSEGKIRSQAESAEKSILPALKTESVSQREKKINLTETQQLRTNINTKNDYLRQNNHTTNMAISIDIRNNATSDRKNEISNI